MQPILVTGGAGFIGAHTCKELAAHGCQPIAFDNLARGHRDAVQWGPFVQGDILKQDDLDRVFERYQPKSVNPFLRRLLVSANQSSSLLPIIETTYRGLSTCSTRCSGTGSTPLYFQVHARLTVFQMSCRLLRMRHSSRSAHAGIPS